MFEFFIALFGGIYYATKYSADKKSKKRTDKELNSKLCDLRTLWNSVRNNELEKEIKSMISDEAKRPLVNEEVIQVIEKMPESEYCAHGSYLPNEALFIMMVKRGFLPFVDSCDVNVSVDYKRKKALVLWAQYELRNHGITISAKERGIRIEWVPYILEETVK